MATREDPIKAVRAYLTEHVANLGDLTDNASQDGTVHYFRIGQEYTLVLSRELMDLEPEYLVALLHRNQIARQIRSDGKDAVLAVNSSGESDRYTWEEWEKLRKPRQR